MKKQSKNQNSRNIKFKNFGWLLWIVALFFTQVANGTTLTKKETLTDEEKVIFTGSYLEIGISRTHTTEMSIDENLNIKVYNCNFKNEKYKDAETLEKFSKTSLNAKYYLKDVNENKLVVMSDGSLHTYFTIGNSFYTILYKIENIAKEKTITVEELLKTEKKNVQTMKRNFNDILNINRFDTLRENVDIFLGEHFRRIPILDTKRTSSDHDPRIPIPKTSSVIENLKQKFPTIACCIVLITVVTFLCIQCCQSQNEPNTEHLPIEQHETNDLSNYYPSSTDLVMDVKDTGSTQSTQPNIKPSDSISIVLSGNMKTNSSNLFTIESIVLEEVNESKNAQSTETNSNQSFSMTTVTSTDIEKNSPELSASESTDLEVTKSKTTVSESKQNPESTNDTTTQDDFTI